MGGGFKKKHTTLTSKRRHGATNNTCCRPRQVVKLGAIDALELLIKAQDDWAYNTSLY